MAVGIGYFINKQSKQNSSLIVRSENTVSNSSPIPKFLLPTNSSITPQNPVYVEAGKPMQSDQVSQVSDEPRYTPASSETVGTTVVENNVQVLKTTYSSYNDILPNEFSVKLGIPVRLEITVKDDGVGCMSSIMVPGYSRPILLTANEPISIEFTPKEKGELSITCAMGMPRGIIKVS